MPGNPFGSRTLREALRVRQSPIVTETAKTGAGLTALRASTWGEPRQVLQRLVPPQRTGSPRPRCLTTALAPQDRAVSPLARLHPITPSPHTVIIALTANAFEEQRQTMISAGCDDFISKPFREEEIFEKLAKHLGVHYVYFEPTANNQNTSQQCKKLNRKDLAVMPDAWIQKLHQAARECNDESISELLKQIPTEFTNLIQILKQLTYHFRFDEIMEITNQ
ncbi:response regulator [Fischerella sp. PCC 9605]|uniref:response regulator n=1 Tax=Fischerella sp. PCC 9605 TaxID=1173024 RepID=UPI0004790330|nr:response regulator [Fischerella sp. PCC 9605]